MALSKWNIQCCECNEKHTFIDAKDITFAHWKIIGWKIESGEPVCVCEGCERRKPKNIKK
jgi:hypothetical protein